MTDGREKIVEQLRRYRALLAATPDPTIRAALQEMIGRLEARLAQQKDGDPPAPPPLGKHPNR
jgi:hypothetical protein